MTERVHYVPARPKTSACKVRSPGEAETCLRNAGRACRRESKNHTPSSQYLGARRSGDLIIPSVPPCRRARAACTLIRSSQGFTLLALIYRKSQHGTETARSRFPSRMCKTSQCIPSRALGTQKTRDNCHTREPRRVKARHNRTRYKIRIWKADNKSKCRVLTGVTK
jgi:hypothetical protein